MANKKQNKNKRQKKVTKKKEIKNTFLQNFWYNRMSLNNSLFFWGLSSVIVIALFLGAISLFAAQEVDIVVNVNTPETPSGGGGGTGTPIVNPVVPPSVSPPLVSPGTQTPGSGATTQPTPSTPGAQTPTDDEKPSGGEVPIPDIIKKIQAYFEAYEAKDIEIKNQEKLMGDDVFDSKLALGDVLFDLKEGEIVKNSLFSLISFLTSILAFYGIYFFYNSRKYLGYVFNSKNGERIANAKIELRSFNDKRIMQTVITNKKGKFWFKLKDIKTGNYYISVTKLDYVFPSKYWMKKENIEQSIYFGDKIKISRNKFRKLKIPLDPLIR